LGERLARRGVVADVFVVGGAAMALAYDATRVTRDVDARFLPHGIVVEEARRVAQDLGLPSWWLNEQASVYISGKDDPGKRRVFDHPGLRVMAASPEHVFAMKALAARARDVDDLRLLAGIVACTRPKTLCGYARSSAPTKPYPQGRPQSSGSFLADPRHPGSWPGLSRRQGRQGLAVLSACVLVATVTKEGVVMNGTIPLALTKADA
jgi:hypothetical protein